MHKEEPDIQAQEKKWAHDRGKDVTRKEDMSRWKRKVEELKRNRYKSAEDKG